jgi:hypothetical protein
MNFQHVHTVKYFDGIIHSGYPARGEMDPSYHDGRKAFKKTCFRREALDLKRPDGRRVFLGAIDATGENEGKLQVYYFNDDANEAFVQGIRGNLPMYVAAYLKHVKGYSERSIASIMQACQETYRLNYKDCKWDSTTRSISPLAQINRQGFADRMAQRNMQFLLPEVMSAYSKSDPTSKTFSDAAKSEVADGFRFKNRPGFNPKEGDAASCLSENSHTTNGAASNRSVTTQDVQCKMPELRIELHQLQDQLRELSPTDDLFEHDLVASTDIDQLSFSSNASAIIETLFKDTQECIRLFKVRISELQQDAPPPGDKWKHRPFSLR